MPPTIIRTTRATGNIEQIQRPVVLTKEIENLSVSDIPLVLLSKEFRRKSIEDYNTNWLEDQYMPRVDQVNGAQLAADTTIEVDNAAYFKPGDIVTVTTTLETMRVTAVSVPGGTITVVRSWGTRAAADISDNDQLLIIGYASTEGGDAPEMRSTVPSKKTNYVQTFRTSYVVTRGLGQHVKLLTGSDLQYQRTKHLEEHMIDIERSAMFGESREDLSNTDDPLRTMGGLNEFITVNVSDIGGVLVKADFDAFLKDVFQKGSKTKWLFGAANLIGAISGFAAGVLRSRPEDETFGIHVKEYISPHGRVNIVEHRLLGETTEFAQWGFLVDMSKLFMPVLADTVRRENIQTPRSLKMEEEYVTELTMEIHNDAAHGIIQGVTG